MRQGMDVGGGVYKDRLSVHGCFLLDIRGLRPQSSEYGVRILLCELLGVN